MMRVGDKAQGQEARSDRDAAATVESEQRDLTAGRGRAAEMKEGRANPRARMSADPFQRSGAEEGEIGPDPHEVRTGSLDSMFAVVRVMRGDARQSSRADHASSTPAGLIA
eukprot:4609421-Amphidinium_carterae.1